MAPIPIACPEKTSKKMEKKACQPPASSARPKSERQTHPFARSKKMKKKLVRPLEI
jgi:hypothetical protein